MDQINNQIKSMYNNDVAGIIMSYAGKLGVDLGSWDNIRKHGSIGYLVMNVHQRIISKYDKLLDYKLDDYTVNNVCSLRDVCKYLANKIIHNVENGSMSVVDIVFSMLVQDAFQPFIMHWCGIVKKILKTRGGATDEEYTEMFKILRYANDKHERMCEILNTIIKDSQRLDKPKLTDEEYNHIFYISPFSDRQRIFF